MSGCVDSNPCQSSLRMCRSQVPGPCILRKRRLSVALRQYVQAGVIRHKQVLCRCFLEPLVPVPRHVLDSNKSTIGEEQEIKETVSDDGIISALDNARQRPKTAGNRAITAARGEELVFAADQVVCGWGVDGFLDVGPVEVVIGAGTEGGETELVPEVGAEVCKMIEVEAGVDVVGCGDDVAPNIAAWNGGIGGVWQFSLGGKLEGVLHEVGVAAFVGAFVDVRHKGGVEIEDILEIVEGHDRGG